MLITPLPPAKDEGTRFEHAQAKFMSVTLGRISAMQSRNIRAFFYAAMLLGALSLPTSASAGNCSPSKDPSPASRTATGIKFFNDTHYAMRVQWAGFDGFLKPMSQWIQPGESTSFRTYVGHTWFVEVNTPDGRVCSGPISANSRETCVMRVLFDDDEEEVGYDGGACDFEP